MLKHLNLWFYSSRSMNLLLHLIQNNNFDTSATVLYLTLHSSRHQIIFSQTKNTLISGSDAR